MEEWEVITVYYLFYEVPLFNVFKSIIPLLWLYFLKFCLLHNDATYWQTQAPVYMDLCCIVCSDEDIQYMATLWLSNVLCTIYFPPSLTIYEYEHS